MSEEKKRKISLNCYMDFNRAAVTYFRNPKDTNTMVFFDHGVKLLRRLQIKELLNKCKPIRKKILDAKNLDVRLADDIFTIGLLVKV